MMNLHILAVGTLKGGNLYDLCWDYKKRSEWPVVIRECRDDAKLADAIHPDWPLWVMDERGESIKSILFANHLQEKVHDGHKNLQLVIGGADGLPESILKSADKLISFGKQTWPHMLVRVMLLEQLYRAQQILKGHPYHRE